MKVCENCEHKNVCKYIPEIENLYKILDDITSVDALDGQPLKDPFTMTIGCKNFKLGSYIPGIIGLDSVSFYASDCSGIMDTKED